MEELILPGHVAAERQREQLQNLKKTAAPPPARDVPVEWRVMAGPNAVMLQFNQPIDRILFTNDEAVVLSKKLRKGSKVAVKQGVQNS